MFNFKQTQACEEDHYKIYTNHLSYSIAPELSETFGCDVPSPFNPLDLPRAEIRLLSDPFWAYAQKKG